MLMNVREIVDVARRLRADMGPGGAGVIAARAEALRVEGQEEDAAFWRRVAQAMEALGRSRPSEAGPSTS